MDQTAGLTRRAFMAAPASASCTSVSVTEGPLVPAGCTLAPGGSAVPEGKALTLPNRKPQDLATGRTPSLAHSEKSTGEFDPRMSTTFVTHTLESLGHHPIRRRQNPGVYAHGAHPSSGKLRPGVVFVSVRVPSTLGVHVNMVWPGLAFAESSLTWLDTVISNARLKVYPSLSFTGNDLTS